MDFLQPSCLLAIGLNHQKSKIMEDVFSDLSVIIKIEKTKGKIMIKVNMSMVKLNAPTILASFGLGWGSSMYLLSSYEGSVKSSKALYYIALLQVLMLHLIKVN